MLLDTAPPRPLSPRTPSQFGAELRRMASTDELDVPLPGCGRTPQRWAALAWLGRRDLALARLARLQAGGQTLCLGGVSPLFRRVITLTGLRDALPCHPPPAIATRLSSAVATRRIRTTAAWPAHDQPGYTALRRAVLTSQPV